MEETKNTPGLSLRTILKILAALCMMLVFFPAFVVSCSGREMEVTVATAVQGVESYGEYIVEPSPIMLICYILPIVILVALFAKQMNRNSAASTIILATAVDLLVWFVFYYNVKELANDNYCDFKTTGYFTLNMITHILLILCTTALFFKNLSLDSGLLATSKNAPNEEKRSVPGLEMHSKPDTASEESFYMSTEAVSKEIPKSRVKGTLLLRNATIDSAILNTSKEAEIKHEALPVHSGLYKENNKKCIKCGAEIEDDSKFCANCGTPVQKLNPEKKNYFKGMLQSTQKEQEKFCSNCGKRLPANVKFCAFCGEKLDD